jgi:signal transduction histidine kinase
LKISVNTKGEIECIKEIRPLEITTLIDVFISNSEKKETDAKNIVFNFFKKKENLIIEVVDDGKRGIEKENLEKIFELGYTTTNGSGIGLYQAMDIVKKMGGNLVAESVKGIGTTFIITL